MRHLFPIRYTQNYERLKSLSAIDAIQKWLNGEFTIGEEDALLHAVKRDTNTNLTDIHIIELILDAMDDGETAEQCLNKISSS